MLHLISPPLHRAALRLAHAIRKRWWRLRKPLIVGCRVVALDSHGRVLLIRQSYGSGAWLVPSGGFGNGEDPVAAAQRELREEVGCTLGEAAELAVLEEELHGATNRVHVIAGRLVGEPRPDRREVVEAGFFALDALPEPMPAPLRAGLPRWVRAFAG